MTTNETKTCLCGGLITAGKSKCWDVFVGEEQFFMHEGCADKCIKLIDEMKREKHPIFCALNEEDGTLIHRAAALDILRAALS